MSSQMTVIIAGIVLVVAIVVALVIMRRGDSRFTYDTQHGTAPRATEGEGNTAATAFKGRFSILTTGVGAMFAALAVKLWGMQMVSSDYYEKQANSNQTRTVTTPAVRGRILDRNGVALVQNRPSLAVVAYRDLAEDEVLVRHLANVLGMPYVAVLRNIQDNSEGAQSLHTIATDVRRSTVAYIKEHAGEFPGVKIAERTERQYPYGETACHILGYTGTITSEQLEAQNKKTSGDDDASAGKITYQSGDIVGQAGVESYYENLLQGIRGEQTVKVDASGNVTGQAGAVPAKAGSDIKLTLDLKIQQACETALASAIELPRPLATAMPATALWCVSIPTMVRSWAWRASPSSIRPSLSAASQMTCGPSSMMTRARTRCSTAPLADSTCRPRPSSRSRHWPVLSLEPTRRGRRPTARAIGRVWASRGASTAGCIPATAP